MNSTSRVLPRYVLYSLCLSRSVLTRSRNYIFLLDFSHSTYVHCTMYIIENWVWLCWLGLELVLHNAAVVSPLNWILSSLVSLPLAGRPYTVVWPQKFFCQLGLRTLQPPAIPQFLPPCSRVTGLCHQSRPVYTVHC